MYIYTRSSTCLLLFLPAASSSLPIMQPGTGTNNIQLGNGGGFGMNPMLNMTSPLNAAGTNPHGFGMQGAAVPMAGGGFSGGPPPPAQGFSGPGGGALALQKTGLPCEYWRAGMCNRGASCFYNHDPAEFGVFKPKPIAPPAAPGRKRWDSSSLFELVCMLSQEKELCPKLLQCLWSAFDN